MKSTIPEILLDIIDYRTGSYNEIIRLNALKKNECQLQEVTFEGGFFNLNKGDEVICTK